MDFLKLKQDSAVVLVIDDDPDILSGIKHGLEVPSVKLEIYTAENGLQGLQQAKKHIPDIVIVDLNMPDLDGFAVVDEMRGDPQLAHAKVILLTAQDTPKNQWESIDRKIDDFIGKPFDLRELEARILTLLMD